MLCMLCVCAVQMTTKLTYDQALAIAHHPSSSSGAQQCDEPATCCAHAVCAMQVVFELC